jgi:hypothetical protein
MMIRASGVQMLLFSSFRRSLAVVTLLVLFIVALPLDPASAEPLPPATTSAVVEGLEANGAPAEPEPAERGAPEGPGTSAAAPQVVESVIHEAAFPFTSVGVRGVGSEEVELRYLHRTKGWSAWEQVELLDVLDGPDAGTAEDVAVAAADDGRWTSEAIWVGEATHLQVRVTDGDPDDLEIHTIDSMGLSESIWQRVGRNVRALGPRPAEASTTYPGLVTRAQWGADESWRTGSPSYATVKFAVLHHTANGNDYTREQAPALVRSIYHWHTQGNKWADVGYNVLVDRYGVVYEGRFGGIDRGVVGAHAFGWNSGSFGVGVIGNFEAGAAPAAAVTAVADFIGWKYDVHGIDRSAEAQVTHNSRTIPTLVGHRDVGSTVCPGANLYAQMPNIRSVVASSGVASPPTATSAGVDGNGWTPVQGDWNGDGRTTIGWFRDGMWRLRNLNSSGSAHLEFTYGQAGDRPIVGDWNGDGRDTVGVFRNGRWLLRNQNSAGTPDHNFSYGRGIDWPVPGDWNGNGRDTVGIVRDGEWHLRNSLSGGAGEITFRYGRVTRGDIPLIGDWNASGQDTVGIIRDGDWHLRNTHSGGHGEIVFRYGRVSRGDLPLTGDWNRDGRTTVGIVRQGEWHLRNALSGGPANISFVHR